MAKVNILIVADTAIGGKHVKRGTVIEIDDAVASDVNNYAMLKHAGRVAWATDENKAKLKDVMESEAEAAEKREAHLHTAGGHMPPDAFAKAVAAAVVAMNKKAA